MLIIAIHFFPQFKCNHKLLKVTGKREDINSFANNEIHYNKSYNWRYGFKLKSLTQKEIAE